MKILAKSLLAFLAIVLLNSTALAKLQVVNSTNTTLTVIYTPELQSMTEIEIDGQQFAQPIFKDAGNILTEIGYPQLIATKKQVAVPSPTGFKIQDIEIGNITKYNFTIAPTYILGRELTTNIDRRAYLNRPIENWANIEYSGISRDKYLAILNIVAAKYNPATKSIEVPQYVKVTISFDNIKSNPNKKFQKSKITNHFLNSNVADNWTISDEKLYFKNDIEKTSKSNKIQSQEVLSSGNWYKINISETGVYELTADYLRGFGINIPNDKLNTIKIFGNGGRELPQNVDFAKLNNFNQQKIIVKKNGDGSLKSIIFFGAGTTGFEFVEKPSFYFGKKVIHYLNHFSKNNNYLLTWGGDEGQRSNPIPKIDGNIVNNQKTFTRRAYYEEELVSAYQGGSGKQFFGRTYFSEPFEHNLINVADEGTITYKFSLGQARADKSNGIFSAYNNGDLISNNLIIPLNTDEAIRQLFEITRPLSDLKNKNKCVLKFDYNNPGSPGSNGIFDYYELHYTSKNIADNGEIYLFTDPELSGLTQYSFSGFNGEIYAFDITDVGNPLQLKSDFNDRFDLVTDLTLNEPKRFYIASNLKKPVNIENIQIKNLRDTKFNDDVIIITNSKLRESAKKFKEYRESTSNLKIGIFEVDDLYNEYNAGTMDITAIRDFISQAMENWDIKPSYLVLWGDGHFDYRGLITNQTNFVPPHESDDEYAAMSDINSVSTDDYYARVVGNDRTIDLGHGRITINSEEEGYKVIEKIKHYENSSDITNWRTKITLVADDGFSGTEDKKGDGSLFVDDSEDFSASRIPNFLEQKKIYLVEYPSQYTGAGIKKPGVNSEILKTVNEEGTLLLNWYGHGNPQVWAHESVLDRDISIRQMTNYDRLFFLTAATCDFARIDNFEAQSGAELMLLNEYGGSIGVFGSTRIVYASQNHAINREFYKQLFTRNTDGSYPTLGEVIYNVKQTFNQTNDEKYFLLGDPTLRLLIPKYDIVFDSIDGVGINDTSNISVKGLQTVKVKGHISYDSMKDNIVTDFNGKIKIKVLDGSVNIEITDILNRKYDFEKFGGTLANANFEVNNGTFEAEFILPKDISFSENKGQIFGYAYTDDNKFAKGNYDKLKIDGLVTTDISDKKGPDIDINLDSRRFKPGDIVRTEPLLIVDLSDDSGINSTGIGVGHKIEAWIDNSNESIDLTSDYESSFDDYRKGSANKILLGLKPGVHFIKVRAWDIYNNYSVAETYFNIKESTDVVVDDVTASPTPFEENTKILFKHNLNPPVDVKLDIFDVKGSKIRTITAKILTPYEGNIDWDGKDAYGSPVSIGTYYFRLKLDNLNANDTFLKGRTIKIK